MEQNTLVFFLVFILAKYCIDVSEAVRKKCEVDTIVETTGGNIRGEIINNLGISYYSFKGIPYAEPPIGQLRFQAPVPHRRWSGIRLAREHGNICANKWGFFLVNNTAGGDEDCLFVNVYTNDLDGPKKSVMFFIHGGAFMSGSGNTDLYGPEYLLKKDVVLVTINYRYSAFGFLSSGDENAPGNQGLKDLVLGLKWIKDNIVRFGGNKNDVTIFGHSAGSTAVHYLMISDLAKGLFHKAIMQSGTAFMTCVSQLKNPLPQAQLLARRLNISYVDTKDLIEKLQKVSFEEIRNVEAPLFSMGLPWAFEPFEYVPSIEPKSTKNAFLTETPYNRMVKGKYAKIPIMIGSPSFEGIFIALLFYSNSSLLSIYNNNPKLLIPREFEITNKDSYQADEAVKELQKLYFNGSTSGTLEQWLQIYSDYIFRFGDDRLVRFHAKDNLKKIFYYKFSFNGTLNFFKRHLGLENFSGSSHGDELFYLFKPYEEEFKSYIPGNRENLMIERMTTMWTNFAKYGNPTANVDGKIITEKWKPYTAEGEEYFNIDDELTNESHLERADELNKMMKKFTGHI
ncbi:hypothetical protein PVAND_013488 [Polypedilum vanderplanki]|uniref:Carboxylic ester hydrolase n=1 Tax=Polypedilum vanderplanki TaxID=319348 RepID=A0A9J6CQT7_POLVA|nr:hypothetical protein PVAND_013488 [Polypedilum vanderplanki]